MCHAVGPTRAELDRARQWVERLFPSGKAPRAKLRPGITILRASYHTRFNENGWGQPLTLGQRCIERGIYVDAPSHLRVRLSKPADRFTAMVGIDNNPDTQVGQTQGRGSVTFDVVVGGRQVRRTDVLTLKNSPQTIDVRLNGAQVFDLRVGIAGDHAYDQSVWGYARVIYKDGTDMLLDELPLLREIKEQVPFSFVYGGQSSSDLLPKWQRSIAEERIDATRVRRLIRYKDPKTQMTCEVEAIVFADAPAIDWVLRFINEGTTDTPILERVRTLDAVWPVDPSGPVMVHRSRGSSCRQNDFQPITQPLARDKAIEFGSAGGRSSNGALPFFQVQWPDGGMCVSIGWSGQWRARVGGVGHSSDRDVGLSIQAGIEQVRTTLRPGEAIRVARVLLVHWAGDDHQRGHNLHRRVMLEHYLPRIKGQLVYPIIAHPSSYDELRNSNERNQTDIIRATHRAGLEGYWLDAYWFEGYFPEGVGNWAIPIEQTVRKKDYPNGIRPLSDLTHELGMKFILWFEPERVAPGTHIDKAYPDWVLRIDNRPGGVFDLGNPEARRWMTDYLCQCIDAYKMDVLRIDHNIDPLGYWRAADEVDRQGMTEIRCVTGLYTMWDEIRRRFPNIFIDNCASGGRRIDLETNMRSIPMWRSDYNDNNVRRGDPIGDQGMTMGLSVFMPMHAGPAWRAEPYYWRSANVGGPIPYWDMRKDDFSHAVLALAVKEAQDLRPYFLGDLWHLTDNSVDPKAWVGYQYHRPEQDDGFACFFRREESPYRVLDVSFRGLKAGRRYKLHYFYDYAAAKEDVVSGEALADYQVEIPKRGSSLLMRFGPAGDS
jgi:alpha-galactosidase